MLKKRHESKNLAADGKITITGVITPIDWDDEDNIVAISISTSEEEEYIVEDSPLGEELFNLINEYVKVTGFIEEDEYGDKTISVVNYKLIKEDN